MEGALQQLECQFPNALARERAWTEAAAPGDGGDRGGDGTPGHRHVVKYGYLPRPDAVAGVSNGLTTSTASMCLAGTPSMAGSQHGVRFLPCHAVSI
jgi:hypothetical protein